MPPCSQKGKYAKIRRTYFNSKTEIGGERFYRDIHLKSGGKELRLWNNDNLRWRSLRWVD